MHALELCHESAFAERVRTAVAVAAEHADAVDREGRFPIEAVDALRAGRLLGIAVPRELGGEGGSLAEVVNICSALGGACASTGMVFAMRQISLANLTDCASGGVGRHLRDIQSARLMIGNDRVLASTGQMMLVGRSPLKLSV